MGLGINNYHYSYHTLHALRRWALTVEKNPRNLMCEDYGYGVLEHNTCGKCVYCLLNKTKRVIAEEKKITQFTEFINHSDCEDYYIAYKKSPVIREFKKGNLTELKKEMIILKKNIKSIPADLKKPFLDFYKDVMEENNILKFS
jgi:hypothetical protein